MGFDNSAGSRIGRTQCAQRGENQGWFSTAHVHKQSGFDFFKKIFHQPFLLSQIREYWSGWWESNPRSQLGKLMFCHWTTPANTLRTHMASLPLHQRLYKPRPQLPCCGAQREKGPPDLFLFPLRPLNYIPSTSSSIGVLVAHMMQSIQWFCLIIVKTKPGLLHYLLAIWCLFKLV